MDNIKPSVVDYLKHAKYFCLIWISFATLALRRGPLSLLLDMRRYPWLLILLKAPMLMGRLAKGRAGIYREANEILISFIVKRMVAVLARTLKRDKKLILHQEMVPPEISTAMGLSVWPAELLSILLPLLDSHAAEAYIDRSENEGIPPDICSHVKMTLGIVLNGEMPPASVIVSSNLPCDGNMTGYEITRRWNNASIFRLDIPFNFYNDRAADYFAGELKRMIAWLEEKTPGRMDWERLRRICEERNRMAEIEIELWDMISARPAPMAAEPVYLGHLWAFNADPGSPAATRFFRRIAGMTRRNLEKGARVVPNERFRAVLWNPPLLHFSELFRWAEEAYGVTLLIDSMTYQLAAADRHLHSGHDAPRPGEDHHAGAHGASHPRPGGELHRRYIQDISSASTWTWSGWRAISGARTPWPSTRCSGRHAGRRAFLSSSSSTISRISASVPMKV